MKHGRLAEACPPITYCDRIRGEEASVLGKAVRIDDDDRLAKALAEGAEFLIVGRRRFRLVEVTESPGEGEWYEPTDPEEVRALEEALHDDSEPFGPEEGRKYLKERLRQHGIG